MVRSSERCGRELDTRSRDDRRGAGCAIVGLQLLWVDKVRVVAMVYVDLEIGMLKKEGKKRMWNWKIIR
ncbi:unnamed protein product [Colias eurytheme]|nr:unnamed protein product [Colias eurytheme]